MKRFLYKTVRAEWIVHQWRNMRHMGFVEHGPYASEEEAYRQIEILKARELTSHKYEVGYRETPVDIDPILSSAVQGIAGLVTGWFGRTDPTNPFAPRPSGYVKMAHVEASMKQLSEIILKTFEINKENPDVPEDQDQG